MVSSGGRRFRCGGRSWWPWIVTLGGPWKAGSLTSQGSLGLAESSWDGVRYRRGPTGSPRLDGVIAVVECTVDHSLPGGDHEIIVGRVRHVATGSDGVGPLVFWRGGYASLGGQICA